jgi:hypothetical protein
MAPLLHPGGDHVAMLQSTYKLKLTERVKAKCSRHPRYNPEKVGRAPRRYTRRLFHLFLALRPPAGSPCTRCCAAGVRSQSWAVGTATRTAPEESYNCDGGATLTNLDLETPNGLLHAALSFAFLLEQGSGRERPIWFRSNLPGLRYIRIQLFWTSASRL